MNNKSGARVNIFSRPEDIDAVINAKLAGMPRKNGNANSIKNAWTDDELALRNAVIMEYITQQGLSKTQTAQQISTRWDIAFGTAKNWVNEASKNFIKSFDDDVEESRRLWLERCESILQDAIDSKDKQSALRALDLMGKAFGIYRETVNVNGDNTVHFDFS